MLLQTHHAANAARGCFLLIFAVTWRAITGRVIESNFPGRSKIRLNGWKQKTLKTRTRTRFPFGGKSWEKWRGWVW
uniref:Putative secreted protein n=1 Tax=Anopheles darlingi TaxID=43151 RepID=A0A2M4D073_ANODA